MREESDRQKLETSQYQIGVQVDTASSVELEQCLTQTSGQTLRKFCQRCQLFLQKILQDIANKISSTWEIHLLLCSDRRIIYWNRQFRKQDQATDILSFPRTRLLANDAGLPPIEFPIAFPIQEPGDGVLGGDLLLSLQSWLANCQQYQCSLEEELQRLLIHGILHLAGWDHDVAEDPRRPQSWGPMLQYQEKILQQSLQRRAILTQ